MEYHLARNLPRRSKRHLIMNELNSSSSFHYKKPRLCQQETFNQNRSFSPIIKSKHSLKEFDLSDKDYVELRQALKTIFSYLQPNIKYNDKQRLTSPYLKQRLIDDDDQSLPLYTNEYFIRNGLLNHNDGPDIYDEIFSSRNLNHSKSIVRFESLPLELLSNEKYFLTALTSNFTIDQPNLFKYRNETESMLIRRKKVQTWEKENILQQINNDEKTSIVENISSSRMYDKEKGNDDLFPLVKKFAPYIIIRQNFEITSGKRTSDVVQRRKKNCLLEEFESVLTAISKK